MMTLTTRKFKQLSNNGFIHLWWQVII